MLVEQTSIIVVRHGETVWNVEGRWQGHFNSPLTDKGKLQAEALAKRLKAIDFNHLYSSDLGRAFETAKPIAAIKGLEIKTDQETHGIDSTVEYHRRQVGEDKDLVSSKNTDIQHGAFHFPLVKGEQYKSCQSRG